MKNENLSSRIVWADVVRLLAIFMVICAHCADPFNVSPQARLNPDFNFWGTIYGSLLRPCVPLFVMLTGLLILPVRMTTGAFYKKTAHAHSVAVSDCFGCLQPVSGTDGRRRTGCLGHQQSLSVCRRPSLAKLGRQPAADSDDSAELQHVHHPSLVHLHAHRALPLPAHSFSLAATGF